MTSDEHAIAMLRAWNDVLDDSSYYEILGVLELADAAAIQAAFHDFALAFHPDQYTGATRGERDAAHRVYRRGAEAYRVLSDPALRAKYDQALAGGHLRLVGGVPARRVVTKHTLKSLEDVSRSPAAKLLARRADEHIGRGELDDARRLLRDALAQDGYSNAELEERLEALDTALFASGG